MSFSPERQIKRVDNKGKIVALASVMAATAGFGALTLPKEAYGQEPTQEPIATDVVTGQTEPTPAPTEAPLPYLKIDPLTNECVAVVFQPKPEQIAPANVEPVAILQPDVTPAPTPIATELPTTGQAEPTPVVVAQGEPSEYTKEEVELFEDCAPDTEPVKTIIVYEEIQPEVTPTPEPNTTNELKDYKYFIEKEHPKISFEDFTQNYLEFYINNPDGINDPTTIIDVCKKALSKKGTLSEKLFECNDLLNEALITYYTLKTPESLTVAEQGFDFFYNKFKTKIARESFEAKVKKIYEYFNS